jgi:putative nucleotidyltransferase with HDIG domain
MNRCPGQDCRYWTPDDIFDVPCPQCGVQIEFWKTDRRRRCYECGAEVPNPKLDLGCAEWCRYAQGCIAMSLRSGGRISSQLIHEMVRVFGADQGRIRHALQVLTWAEELLDAEGGDPLVVRAAAILHDIGAPQAQRKHGSAAARLRRLEGPGVAREVLEKLHVDPPRIEHICRIVASLHSTAAPDTLELRMVRDAEAMVRIWQLCARGRLQAARAFAGRALRTRTAQALAEKRFLRTDPIIA